MGGICGILDFKDKIDKETIKNMNKPLFHRGPDGSGYYLDNHCGLGCQTLKTFSKKEKIYPISNEDNSIHLAIDGEIYNSKKIRLELGKKGHRFNTDNMPEVIIHLYEETGDKFLDKIEGVFSLALWDSSKRKLILAKDKFGLKPLYYLIWNNRLLFSSELKSFLNHPGFKKRIDRFALRYCLQYWYIPRPYTIFEGVKNLREGSLLLYEKNRIKEIRYNETKFIEQKNNKSYYVAEIRHLLKKSLLKRTAGEYPIGVTLSGGIDSSAIVALLSQIRDEPIKTYSVGFADDNYYNEFKYSDIVAAKYRTDHSKIFLNPDDIKYVPKTIWQMEIPTGITNLSLAYLNYKASTERIMFVGDGADELFAPDQCRRFYYLDKLKYAPRFITQSVIRSIDGFGFYKKEMEYLKRMYPLLTRRERLFLQEYQRIPEEDLNTDTIGYAEKKGRIISGILKRSRSNSRFTQVQYANLKTYTTDMVFNLVDRMGMAHSTANRFPFLDYNFVKLVVGVPLKYKLKGYAHKYLLQESMKNILPKEIIKRKKEPFLPTPNKWVLNQKEIVLHFVSGFRKRNIVKMSVIDNLTKSNEIKNNTTQLWNIFTAEMWFRMFIDNENTRENEATVEKLW